VNALTHRTDGDRVLAEFAQGNLFTVALPEEPVWYRYHPLLADLLRSNLRRQMPQRLPELHR
jgi:LuxR family maltose regulon positive regulatory protein